MHFPHIRINDEGTILIAKDADEFHTFIQQYWDQVIKRDNWKYSTLDQVDVIQSSDKKVHLKIKFTRYRADNIKIATYKSLRIFTKKKGRWGLLGRSTFAP